jgi:predicted nucleic acid-binding protein
VRPVIVAAETNFVLELAFGHKEASECRRLIKLATNENMELVVPACSLFEPYETLVRRRKQRDKLLKAFKEEVNELARSDFYANLPEKVEEMVAPISDSSYVYERSLREAIVSVLRTSTIIPLSSNVMQLALEFQNGGTISPQDSVVAASVVLFMRERQGGPKVFANLNSKDFVAPHVQACFRQCVCRLISSFSAAMQFAEATLRKRAS